MIVDLFSKRQRRVRREIPDVYSYEAIPQELRVQIVHIWQDTLGNASEYHDSYLSVKRTYQLIVEILRREYGVFALAERKHYDYNYMEELKNFFLHEEDTEKILDAVEVSFRCIDDKLTRDYSYLGKQSASKIADDAIEELNDRFKEHGIGYQYVEGEIIRVDSQLLHTEAVKPALCLLSGQSYAGAQQEFLNAYEHYRHKRYKEALNDALKSFESTMKAICDKRGWAYDPNATSKRLIEICWQNDLIPTFWQQNMAALRSLLESGVPTGRNKLGGHGQGAQPVSVPNHLVAYVLHMTASAIVFLVEAEKSLT